jgi:hypothetical protein
MFSSVFYCSLYLFYGWGRQFWNSFLCGRCRLFFDSMSADGVRFSLIYGRCRPFSWRLIYIGNMIFLTPSIKNGKNMQTPSTNKLIPKRTTPSVNKLNYSKKWTTPSVNKLNYNKNGRHHLLKMKRICRRHHLQGRTPSTKN